MQRDKFSVAASFSNAAPSYDSVAQLQRCVGNELMGFLDAAHPCKRLVDLGSGTGFFTEKLLARYPEAQVLGLDIAPGMLRYARAQRAPGLGWVGGDMEALPFGSGSIDVFFSSLAVQWCENLPAFFTEVARALVPGGRVLLATLGPQTLCELRDSWRKVDHYTHVNEFDSAATLTHAYTRAGLVQRAWRAEPRVMYYPSLRELTHELKALGAHNVNRERAPGLTGRQKIKKLREAYEHYRTPKGLPASYDVYWLVLEKPAG
ncbi:malonyl-ACP O-methyltransferase BioC [Simiduia sp. 21SJ11W-1]|uniref:malonyl-ACP O-methyltransferase BioC n=1 Tax=Simiduia sp. 21SJ11W-1 TaxID=2909669 RepID=UPI00209EF8CD|nr:malonyl-ACP O-methyltransferase BioC [Simiduia sp. 21SJ11W-1]UTA47542.1 malonyl-ACP O-methyltransferase BioC [Simiduia sp. 21SJ11W-1]